MVLWACNFTRLAKQNLEMRSGKGWEEGGVEEKLVFNCCVREKLTKLLSQVLSKTFRITDGGRERQRFV